MSFLSYAGAAAARLARRDDVIQLAHVAWEDGRTAAAVLEDLKQYAPELSEGVRADRLGDLIAALAYEKRVADDEVDPEDGETRDGLKLAAANQIHTFADALIGEPS